ncbi:TPA: filamentous hemagglutinin N-terminal domain-containing protein [Vibrio vulnificus]|nr:filamentous hemagglutinin N-terminal domain-containing protein [Vibrio vulnificus]
MSHKNKLPLYLFIFLSPYSVANHSYTYESGEQIKLKSHNASISEKNGKPVLMLKGQKNETHINFDKLSVGNKGLEIDNSIDTSYIITEVISDHPSVFRGEINVTQNPAKLIIINPNGFEMKEQFGISGTIYNKIIAGNAPDDIFDYDDINMHELQSNGSKITISGVNNTSRLSETSLLSKNVSIRKSNLYFDKLYIGNIFINEGENPGDSKITIDKDSVINITSLSGDFVGAHFYQHGNITGNVNSTLNHSHLNNTGKMTGDYGKIILKDNISSVTGTENMTYTNHDVVSGENLSDQSPVRVGPRW